MTAEELKTKIRELIKKRDAYQKMEEGIGNLEEYNRLATDLNRSNANGQYNFPLIFPVIFRDNSVPDIRQRGIYADYIKNLTQQIISLNEELRAELLKNRGTQ